MNDTTRVAKLLNSFGYLGGSSATDTRNTTAAGQNVSFTDEHTELLGAKKLLSFTNGSVNSSELDYNYWDDEDFLMRLRRALALRGQCNEPDSAREKCSPIEDDDKFSECMERCAAKRLVVGNLLMLILVARLVFREILSIV